MTLREKIAAWRRQHVTNRIFKTYKRLMPTMSQTERDAIAAGTVSFEAELFSGKPDWQKLLNLSAPTLTSEEQAFLDGPVNELCTMLDDWEITHELADLPPHVWQFLKEQGFFGLIIPKEYGGKGFSAYAHSEIILRVSGLSITASTTISVPNSLGPGELLMHYGTAEQKQYYLPRLAKGTEIPCFALTSPEAGSDASAMSDHGIICHGEFEGKSTLGIRLQFNKRYITLAPIATVIALAFKLYDPEHLLGAEEDIGITCALIPTKTPGITIGRRHFPLNAPFQNGPVQGKDVFIPLEWMIGGVEQAGNGWRMLMECLAAGRAITLPSSAVGGAKMACYTAGAYARVRKQFNTAIGNFEGIEEALGRMATATYIMDAARKFTISAIDRGEKPSVASAIIKYHTTELGRTVACDSMDIHGGKAICLGPKNYIGRSYQSIPIAITVEGANILTRNMIIFGQGAIRCHPYVLAEMQAAGMVDEEAGFKAFDQAFSKHIGLIGRNILRSLIAGLTRSWLIGAPKGKVKHYFQSLSRFSAAFSLLADVSMIVLGAKLKRKESLSARFGDILSNMYLLSAALKEFYDQGQPTEDLPLIRSVAEQQLYIIQQKFDEVLNNFPNRPVAWLLRMIIFPVGMHYTKPKDALNHRISQLLMAPTATRTRLVAGVYTGNTPSHILIDLEEALAKTIACEPIEKILRDAKQQLQGYDTESIWRDALAKNIISAAQFAELQTAAALRSKVVAVDDFAVADLARLVASNADMYDHAK